MSKGFKMEIITPGNDPILLNVESLITGTTEGEVEFRMNHAPIILSAIPAVTKIQSEEGRKYFFTSSGIIYMKDNQLKFCCDAVEEPSNIDVKRAESAKERAEKRLKENKDIDVKRAMLALARANARLGAANTLK